MASRADVHSCSDEVDSRAHACKTGSPVLMPINSTSRGTAILLEGRRGPNAMCAQEDIYEAKKRREAPHWASSEIASRADQGEFKGRARRITGTR